MPAQTNSAAISLPPRQAVARVAGLRSVHAAFDWIQAHERELSERQLELAAIPAPPFGEEQRAAWLRQRFREKELALDDVHVDEIGNVLAIRPGDDAEARFIAISAHIDTVFPSGTPLNPRREGERLHGPGISDNAAGVSAMLGIVAALAAAGVQTSAPLLFIGNVGEEGEGDLRGMRHIFAHERWRHSIGYSIVIDGANSDTLVFQALGSRRFEVTVRGPGGHSWSDFGAPNPIVLLARAIELFSRTAIPERPKTTTNIGTIAGGTSVNSIPESASMRVDIRSSSADEMERVERALRDALEKALRPAASRAREVSYDIKTIGNRPAAELPEDAHILQLARAVDAHLGVNSRLQRASTDANIPLSLGREAVALGAGGSGAGAHTVHEWYDPRGRDLGIKRILLLALALAGAQ